MQLHTNLGQRQLFACCEVRFPEHLASQSLAEVLARTVALQAWLQPLDSVLRLQR